MKKFFLTILCVILVLVGGLLFFTIRSFNTDTFQKQIIQNITEMTGREFNVIGTTTVSWFPAPQIIMHDVTLANTKGANRAVMLRANKISVELDWGTLLKTPLVIRKIEIEHPTLFLERTDSTHVNWNFPFLFDTMTDLDDGMDQSGKIQARIDTLIIRDGSIDYYNNVSKTKWMISNIKGNLNVETLQGPYTFSGNFTTKEKAMTAQLKVMQLRNGSPVPFTLDILGENNSFSMNFNGSITPNAQTSLKMNAQGSFAVQKPNDFLSVFGLNPLSKELDEPSVGNMTYESADGVDSFKSFTIRFGEKENAVALTGSIAREKSNKEKYNATIAINKFVYNQWQEFLSGINRETLTDKTNPDFNLKLNIQDFIYHQLQMKNVNVELAKRDDRFLIQGGKASLDGKTNVSFDGGSVTQNGARGITCMIVGNSDNINDVLSKFVNTEKINKKALTKTAFKGSVTIYPKEYNLDIQELVLNKSIINGNILYVKTAEKPTITTNLKLKNINFDEYLDAKKSEDKTSIYKLPTLIGQSIGKFNYLQKANAVFDLSFENVIFKTIPAATLKVVGKTHDNTLTFSNISASNLANAKLDGSAIFNKIGTENINVSEMKFNFSTPQLDLFLNKTNLTAEYPFLQKAGKFSTETTLSQNKNIWSINSNNKIKDLSLKIVGKIEEGQDEPVYQNMLINLNYPDIKRFSKEVYYTNAAKTSLTGEFNVRVNVSGTQNDLKISSGTVKIGSDEIGVNGNYKSGKPDKIVLEITAPSINAQKFMWNEFKNVNWIGTTANKEFNFNVLNELDQNITVKTPQLVYRTHQLKNAVIKWHLKGNEKLLTLSELSGLYGTETAKFNASGSISWKDMPSLNMNISMDNITLPDNFLSLKNMSYGEGTVNYKFNIQSHGKTPENIIKNLNGKGNASFSNNVWIGTSLDKITPLIERSLSNRVPQNLFDKEMNRILNSGKTTIEKVELPFNIENGILKAINTELTGAGFTSNPMLVEWDITKNAYDISIPLTLTAYTDLPPFALTVKGNRKNLAYQTNFVDLSSSVSDIVEKDNSRIAKIEQDSIDKKETAARNERQEKIRQAIFDAREAVQQADIKVKPGDNQKAHYLMQNAHDALSVVNNMSVKEILTDAEYMQLTEQSRLAVMKAEEAVAEATNDKFFEERKQLHAFAKSSHEMQAEIERIQKKYPEIEIVQKLLPATKKYQLLLKNLADTAHPNETDEEHQVQMYTARAAYTKVLKGYQYVLRFDPNAKQLEAVSTAVPENAMPKIFEKNEERNSSDNEDAPKTNGQIGLNSEEIIETKISDNEEQQFNEITPNSDNSRFRIRQKISRTSEAKEDTDDNTQLDIMHEITITPQIEMPTELPSKASSLRGTIMRAQ